MSSDVGAVQSSEHPVENQPLIPGVHHTTMSSDSCQSSTSGCSQNKCHGEDGDLGTCSLSQYSISEVVEPRFASSSRLGSRKLHSTRSSAEVPLVNGTDCAQKSTEFPGADHLSRTSLAVNNTQYSKPNSQQCNGYAVPNSQFSLQSIRTLTWSPGSNIKVSGDIGSMCASTPSMMGPMCRFCFGPSDPKNRLIAPCRCTGSVKFIHQTCLSKWIDMSRRKPRFPPRCELCKYEFQRQKKFKIRTLSLPHMRLRDKILHVCFVLALITMITCSVVTILRFTSAKYKLSMKTEGTKLTSSEITTLITGILFFAAFFLAMTSQLKAQYSLHTLIMRCLGQNFEWQFIEYTPPKPAPKVTTIARALAPPSSLPNDEHQV